MIGVLSLIASMIPVGASSEPVEFVHRVDPADNGTLAYGIEYETSDVRAYENLSERGQTVFDRARAGSPYVVTNQSATAPDFEYATDHVALGEGVYAIAYEDEVYSLHTQRDAPGFNIAASLAELATVAARVLSAIFIAAGLLYAGWQQYSQ
ncbi:hypothetical protein [Halobacterium noricense]|uniref:hypothetical protein n=1 Tax=Halobacterium noricense TaxID=223182 RepID=UPI001E57E1F3|nr:hypothetical protein [Halobacterium noricense]UHH26814.1 hypothetical protein LT974_07755 [Halobacterium noricense]